MNDPVFYLEIVIALTTAFLSIFFKVVSRSDRLARFRRDDLVFGLDISAASLILLVTGMVNLATKLVTDTSSDRLAEIAKLQSAPWVLFAFFLGTWSISTLIRWFGWERDEPHLGWGIFVPDFWGLFMLVASVYFVGHYL